MKILDLIPFERDTSPKTILSLFDGMGCGRVALEMANIPVKQYYASEIDKFAISVARANYPDIFHLGDVTKWKDWDIDFSKIDMLIGGSPCFRAGTLITTDKGYKKIEDIKKGDMVLTHLNRFREVVVPMKTLSNKIYKLNIQGSPITHVTEEHPYYTRSKNDKSGQFTEPKWKPVKDLSKGDFIGVHICTVNKDNPNLSIEDYLLIKKYGAVIGDYVWLPFRDKELLNITDVVYNFEVAEDNSYVANNCIVHNCQGFSFAGKQLNFNDERSKLFFVYLDILNAIKKVNQNVIFLLENVVMKDEHEAIITKLLGCEPALIDSSVLSAQGRRRLYWSNIPIRPIEDKHIYLSDIVHENTDGVDIETFKVR